MLQEDNIRINNNIYKMALVTDCGSDIMAELNMVTDSCSTEGLIVVDWEDLINHIDQGKFLDPKNEDKFITLIEDIKDKHGKPHAVEFIL